jgi:ABC-type branched-subunit amino acid transport system substrate-binding protein
MPAFLLVLLSISTIVKADETLTEDAIIGRQIYHTGSDGTKNEINAYSGLTGETVSASQFPCVNCHGQEGEGKTEGGLTIPPVTSKALTIAKYGNATLLKVITDGVGLQGQKNHEAMPRYRLSAKQSRQLITYLNQLGKTDELETGISETDIRLLTLLPLTGMIAKTGLLLKSTLEACIQDINKNESIYGRKLSLQVIDSGAETAEPQLAIIKLINHIKPFAVTSPLIPKAENAVLKTLLDRNIPIIAPLTFNASSTFFSSPEFFSFLPTYSNQAEALVDFWMQKRNQKKHIEVRQFAIVLNDTVTNAPVARAIIKRLTKYNVLDVAVINMFESKREYQQLLLNLKRVHADTLFFLGKSNQLTILSNALKMLDYHPELLGLLAMMSANDIKQADLPVNDMWVASPFSPENLSKTKLADLLTKKSIPMNSPSLQMVSCAAVDFIVQGLKQTGIRITRNKFVSNLDSISSFRVSNTPLLKFDKNNRVCIQGAFILKVNPATGDVFELSDWLSP